MGITKQIWLTLAVVAIGVAFTFWQIGNSQGRNKQAKEPEHILQIGGIAAQEVPFYPYLVVVKYTYKYEPGYPQNAPPVSILTWYAESQKQPSRNKLLAAFGQITQSPKQLERLVAIEILAVSRIENKAWWPGNYVRIDALAPEDSNEPPQE